MDQPDAEITDDYVMDKLVWYGSVNKIVDHILEFREEIGEFGELVYCGVDWTDPALSRRSMELLATEVMPRVNQRDRHVGRGAIRRAIDATAFGPFAAGAILLAVMLANAAVPSPAAAEPLRVEEAHRHRRLDAVGRLRPVRPASCAPYRQALAGPVRTSSCRTGPAPAA